MCIAVQGQEELNIQLKEERWELGKDSGEGGQREGSRGWEGDTWEWSIFNSVHKSKS